MGSKYEVLSATSENTIEILSYDDFMIEVLNNPNCHNIAITGSYGAGKSSLWKSFYQRHRKKHNLFKNYGNFLCKRDRLSIMHGRIDNCLEIEIPRYELNSVNPKDSSDDEIEVEVQILNQILYQENQGKRHRLANFLKSERLIIALIIFIFGAFLGKVMWGDDIFSFLHLDDYGISSLYLYLIILSILSYFLVKFNTCLKLEFSGMGFGVTPEKQEIHLNKEIQRIEEFLREQNINLIVLEDIDRHNNLKLLGDLKRLNIILNQSRKKRGKPSICFLYMIRADLLSDKDLVKFFDAIIPVVPIVTYRNSHVVFLEQIKDNDWAKKIDSDFILTISKHIKDYRLIKHIVNELKIIYSVGGHNNRHIDINILLLSVLIKVNFPDIFNEVLDGKGFIFDLINDYDGRKSLVETHMRKMKSYINKNEKSTLTLKHLTIFALKEILSEGEFNQYYNNFIKNKKEYLRENSFFMDLVSVRYFDKHLIDAYSYLYKGGLSENDEKYLHNVDQSLSFDECIDHPGLVDMLLTHRDYKDGKGANKYLIEHLMQDKVPIIVLVVSGLKIHTNQIKLVLAIDDLMQEYQSLDKRNSFIQWLRNLDSDNLGHLINVALWVNEDFFIFLCKFMQENNIHSNLIDELISNKEVFFRLALSIFPINEKDSGINGRYTRFINGMKEDISKYSIALGAWYDDNYNMF